MMLHGSRVTFGIGLATLVAAAACRPPHAASPGRDGGPSQPQSMTNKIGMSFRLIPAGVYPLSKMGPGGQTMQDWVHITRPFYLGVCEVTRKQYQQVVGAVPSPMSADDLPVTNVTWTEAIAFCERLSELEGRPYYLPSETKWEYACQAGSESAYPWGDRLDADFVWFGGNSGGVPHVVGSSRPNAWGVHDMVGNVWEFVHPQRPAVPAAPADESLYDPAAPTGAGGGFGDPEDTCRPSARIRLSPDERRVDVGFRVMTPVGS